MANLTISSVRIVQSYEQFTAPAGEAFAVGEAMRFDDSTGKVTPANGTDANEAQFEGMAVKAASAANMPVTVLVDGVADVGEALASLAFGAPVYLSDTDGLFADAAGTKTVVCGFVVPGNGATSSDKLLRVIKRTIVPA